MKKCPTCNKENEDDARFCNYCGKDITPVYPGGYSFPTIDILNQKSPFEDIYDTAKKLLLIQGNDIISSANNIKAKYTEAFTRAPFDKMTGNTLNHWENIASIHSIVLDLDTSYQLMVALFRVLFGVEFQGLANDTYRRTVDRILSEFETGNKDLIHSSRGKLFAAIEMLQLSFLKFAQAK